jgi:hypothetical protein
VTVTDGFTIIRGKEAWDMLEDGCDDKKIAMRQKKLKVFLTNWARLMERNKCVLVLNPHYAFDNESVNVDKTSKWFRNEKTRSDIRTMIKDKKYHKINGKKDGWNIGIVGSVWMDTDLGGQLCRICYYDCNEDGQYTIMIDPHNIIR